MKRQATPTFSEAQERYHQEVKAFLKSKGTGGFVFNGANGTRNKISDHIEAWKEWLAWRRAHKLSVEWMSRCQKEGRPYPVPTKWPSAFDPNWKAGNKDAAE